jgi:hypothetical protein
MDKKRECATVKAFLCFYGYPLCSLKEWDRERPDALVQIDGRIIGIEVTTVVEATQRQLAPPQQWTTEAHRIVRAAQELFEKRHTVALNIRVGFRPEWLPKKSNTKLLGEEIATIIETKTPREAFAGAPFESIQQMVQHPAVSRVWIGYTQQSIGGHWEPVIAGGYQYATDEDILKTVGKKEAEVAVYKRVTPDVWLLIDCDLIGQDIFLDLPNLSRGFTLPTGFNRVFCGGGAGRYNWVEIPCSEVQG